MAVSVASVVFAVKGEAKKKKPITPLLLICRNRMLEVDIKPFTSVCVYIELRCLVPSENRRKDVHVRRVCSCKYSVLCV